MTINEILFYIVALDAFAVLAMGIVSAAIVLLDIEAEAFWERVWPATVALVLSSIGSGALIWIGDYMFLRS